MPNGTTYTFRCPLCAKRFTYDEPGEPCCTGPSEMRDDHKLTVMHLVRINRREIAPAIGEARAAGPLILAQ